MQDLLELGSAIHRCSFIQFRVNSCERRQINDRRPTEALPDAAGNKNRAEPAWFHQKIDGFSAKHLNDGVDNARAGDKKFTNRPQMITVEIKYGI